MTPRQKMYRRIWLAGALQPTTIRFETKAEATSFKLKMYAWARPYRADRTLDLELTEARIEEMEIVMEREASGGNAWFVTVRYAWENEELQRIAKEAGIDFGPDAEAKESLKRFLKGLKESERPVKASITPEQIEYSINKEEKGQAYLDGLAAYDD